MIVLDVRTWSMIEEGSRYSVAALSSCSDLLVLLEVCHWYRCLSAGHAGCRGSSSRADQQSERSCSASRAN